MIALLLAGGKGTRLDEMGRFYPKMLIPLGAEPVINHLVEKLMRIKIKDKDIEKIFVLARKSKPGDSLDLETAFKRWKKTWYDGNDRVSVVYQEDLPALNGDPSGAIAGLCRFQKGLTLNNIEYDSILVIAADNYIEDNLQGLIDLAKQGENVHSVFNIYYEFGDKERIRRKYGCLELDHNSWVTRYEEKPADPTLDQTKASTAIYLFPKDEFNRLAEYAKSSPYGMDAPGNFLKWLVNDVYPYGASDSLQLRNQGFGVRGYELKGEWFDIGSKADLIAAIKFYVDRYLLVANTAEDLLLGERAHVLSDKYFFLCKRLSVDPEQGRIRLWFGRKDPVCKLDKNVIGNVPTVSEVKSAAQNAPYWEALEKSVVGRHGRFDQPLDQQLLVSGGVFMFDSDGGQLINNVTRLPRLRTLVPLLEKDPASKTDAGRLTTPAGRMDILDLRQVCYAELCEEMIFYGISPEGHQAKIFAVAPFELREIKRHILNRLLAKNVAIPGIDRERITAEAGLPEPSISLVEIIRPHDISLPGDKSWTVEIFLDDDCQSHCQNVIVILDKPNATIEFRLACYANITGTNGLNPPDVNPFSRQLGRLLGIADGDGFSRRPFVVSASELSEYYTRMMGSSADQLRQYLFESQHDAAKLVAAGAPGTGRFESFNCSMPVLCLTTSVRRLVELIPSLI